MDVGREAFSSSVTSFSQETFVKVTFNQSLNVISRYEVAGPFPVGRLLHAKMVEKELGGMQVFTTVCLG